MKKFFKWYILNDEEFIKLFDNYDYFCYSNNMNEKLEKINKENFFKIVDMQEKINQLQHENFKLRKEINLYTGKRIITELEVRDI